MRYVGGKNQPGVWRRIVNLIPPHDLYIEGCLGSGAVLRMKAAACESIGIDKDGTVLAACDCAAPNLTLLVADIISWLKRRRWKPGQRVFLYLDPPYLSVTKKGRCYAYEMTTAEHKKLLAVIVKLPPEVQVMISGYPSKLYDGWLKGWHRVEYKAYTRNLQPRTEVLWMNYTRPDRLHDLRYVGGNYRSRWNLKRRIKRWSTRLEKMNAIEREALFTALQGIMGHGARAGSAA